MEDDRRRWEVPRLESEIKREKREMGSLFSEFDTDVNVMWHVTLARESKREMKTEPNLIVALQF